MTTIKNIDNLTDFIFHAQATVILSLAALLKKRELTFIQFSLLIYLREHEFLCMTDISKKVSLSTAATTQLVDRLEKFGYAQRLHASDDRRKIMIQATRKAFALIEDCRAHVAKELREQHPDGVEL